ncbi:hypothetical protein [Bacillus sp. CGMCC 1.16541]|nr:hypothetical protein [Bacillus sp. CGMCC 1.16541]
MISKKIDIVTGASRSKGIETAICRELAKNGIQRSDYLLKW